MRKILKRILDEKPWSSSSEFYVGFHTLLWLCIVVFFIWLEQVGQPDIQDYYDSPINEETERLS